VAWAWGYFVIFWGEPAENFLEILELDKLKHDAVSRIKQHR
jgi:hypothetical protein